jgi:hydrogenase nickel incorporation protein HypB
LNRTKTKTVTVRKKILDKNELAALQNRRFFAKSRLFCLNMISSPGSGKTTLLARTIQDLNGRLRIGVIEGDIKTDTDAKIIRAAGAPAFQIETDGACHLSAEQIKGALKHLPCDKLDAVVVENVGNLVCPSDFDLGETARVVVLSIPEGDDKPRKYPGSFAGADIVLINKVDLRDYVEFDMDKVAGDIERVNPEAVILQVSARTGLGMQAWYQWLLDQKESVTLADPDE